MDLSALTRRCGLLSVLLAMTTPSFAASTKKPSKWRVRFLATSTSIRSFGGNEDAYLVEMTDPRGPDNSSPFLALMVDRYPMYREALPVSELSSHIGSVVRLSRDATCDSTLSAIPLRTSPGDPLAVLPERLGYRVEMPQTRNPELQIPCYRLVRR